MRGARSQALLCRERKRVILADVQGEAAIKAAWAGGWVRLTDRPSVGLRRGSAGLCIDRTELILRGDETGREAGVGRALDAMTNQLCLDGYWVVLQSLGAVFRRLVCWATCQLGDITVDSTLGWISYWGRGGPALTN